MAADKYYQAIIDTLQGRTEELRDIPRERLDWSASGAVLELLRNTSGKDRSALIRALGQVIRKHPVPGPAIAQLIHIASSLDLAELEPQVRELQTSPVASEEPVKNAIANFLAYRKLTEPPSTVGDHRKSNGAPRGRKRMNVVH
jgi:hypothetical protein